ncbi:MAG: arylsulfatase A-like enzyme [Pseudohongiellaceae bacterium]
MLALLLAGGAWALLKHSSDLPSRRVFVPSVNLTQAFVDGEFVSTTEHLSFGSARGQRQTVEADLHDFSAAQGFRSRPGGAPPFAWLVGTRPSFELDVLVPTERRLSLRLQGFDVSHQVVTVFFNGHEIGEATLPADGRTMMERFDVPASVQLRGSNTVELGMAEVLTRQLLDEPVPLPFSGAILGCHFLLPGQQEQAPASALARRRMGVQKSSPADRNGRLLVLPADVSGRVALRLPSEPRIVLRFFAEKIEVPLEVSLVEDSGERTVLATLDVHDMVPREVRKDLTPWAGQAVQLDFWAREGRGAVELSALSVLVLDKSEGAETDGAVESPAAERVVPAGSDGEKPWSFLVVVLDAFARDRASAFGADSENTPILANLVSRGLSWSRATSPASYTLSSVGSLLTGQHPLTHGVLAGSRSSGIEELAESAPRLSSELSAAGWRTAAWLTNPNTSKAHGYAAGFDHWDELHRDPALWDQGVAGEHLPSRLRAFLGDAGDEPFFAYVHAFEPHAPWVAAADLTEKFVSPYEGDVTPEREWIERFRTSEVPMNAADWRFLEESYGARLAQGDRTLGELLEALEASGRASDTVVFVTSDHGEAFGEHGLLEHSDHVYSEQVDIPLVMVLPGAARKSLSAPVTLMDLAPTVLGLAGLEAPETMDGDDLLSGVDLGDRPQLARSFGDRPQFSWTRWPMRLVVDVSTRRRELFDLSNDPGELNDLAAKRPATFAWLYRELVRGVIDASERRPEMGELEAQDVEALEKLRTLGYTGVEEGAGEIQGAQDVDPALLVLRGLLQRT